MMWETYVKGMAVLNMNYGKNTYNPENEGMVDLWYELLQHYEDKVFEKAIKQIILNEEFAPKLATISRYCSEIAAPVMDDTEGWGLVVKAIRHYGYTRVEEAVKSLPPTVRKAVEYMGGLKIICESEEPDVVRGQFNKCMAAINQRERAARREHKGLMESIALNNQVEETLQLESQEWKRSSKESVQKGIEHIESIIDELGLRRNQRE